MALVNMSSNVIKHLLALPEPVHKHILRYIGGTNEDPETYGNSLVTLAEVFPYFEPLVDRWFAARFITMKTIGQLCVQMCSYSVYLSFPNAAPPIIQSRICRGCSHCFHFKFGLEEHMTSFHHAKWENLGHRLDHNWMP